MLKDTKDVIVCLHSSDGVIVEQFCDIKFGVCVCERAYIYSLRRVPFNVNAYAMSKTSRKIFNTNRGVIIIYKTHTVFRCRFIDTRL